MQQVVWEALLDWLRTNGLVEGRDWGSSKVKFAIKAMMLLSLCWSLHCGMRLQDALDIQLDLPTST